MFAHLRILWMFCLIELMVHAMLFLVAVPVEPVVVTVSAAYMFMLVALANTRNKHDAEYRYLETFISEMCLTLIHIIADA